jgi:hypothetical protein
LTESPVNSRTIELEKAFLSKLPVHIGFILNAADWSTPDVAKLLSWCASLGIQHITVFDQHGMLFIQYSYGFGMRFRAGLDRPMQCFDVFALLSAYFYTKIPHYDDNENFSSFG